MLSSPCPLLLILMSACSQHPFLIKQLPVESCAVAMETWVLYLLSRTTPTELEIQAQLCVNYLWQGLQCEGKNMTNPDLGQAMKRLLG